MTMLRRTVVKSLALLMAATLLASCDPFGLRDVLRAASRSPLSLDPTDVVVPAGATLTFTADGGIPPYAWSVFSGVGSIDADSGDYLASLSTGAAVVRVTDAAGSTADADVTIEELVEGLTITPSAITVTVNAAVQFGAVGGTGSYTYDFAGTGSGSPDLNPATGYYVAGSVPGTDTVRVSDGSSPPDTATVTVVPLDSAVDYSVTSTAGLPSSAVAGSVIGGGVTFTLANTGPGDGNAIVSCRVYLSDDVTLDGGDVVVTEGITGALASGGSTPVGLGGDWPSGPVGPGFLIVTVSAADDTSPGNNTSAAAAFTLDPRPVDYDVISVSHTTGTFTGQSVTGSFTVRNIGTAAGAVTLHWFVYASTDTLLDGGDYLLQSGTHAALAPAVPTPIAIASTWPTTPAAYRLLVTVSAADDVAGGNDIGWSSAITVTGAPPADIDYHAAAPVNTGGTNAGGAMTGTFQVTNDGTIAGSQTLYWTVYRSPDATLEIGSDDPVAMGSRAGLGPTPPNPATTIPYSGTWPASADTWYLFAVVSAGDDVAPGDNESTGTMVSTTAPVVDYMVQVFTETSSPVAGDPIVGTLQLHNEGSAGGSQSITWWVFISQDAVLNPFGDLPVDAGTIGPLGIGGDSAIIPFDGNWPVYPSPPWTWRLYVLVQADDEVDPADNTSSPLVRSTISPNADYDIVSVSSTGTTAGYPLTGSFTVTNLGPHDGTQAVPWRAYLSTNAVYDDGVDTLIDSGVIPSPGLIKLTPTPETFDGTWPEGADTWYLVVVLDAGDDQTPGNDWGASGPVSTVDPDVNYDVLTVATTGAPPLAGGPLTGEFTVENIGTADGRHAVGWTAYRSDDATLTIGVDPVIASGSTVELTASDSVTIPFSNTWPASLTMKTYYLFVRVIVADDILATDNTGMSVMVVVNPPNVDYDVVSITNTGALVAGGALSGSLEIRNIGTVNGSRTVNWYVYRSLDLVFVEGTDPVIASGSIPGGLPFATSAYPTFNGTWPEDTVAHTYYYYVKLITADDIAAGNDDQFSAGNVVNPPAAFPDYRVEAPVVQPEGAPSTLLSASGPHSFQIREAAGTAGTKPINWKVYASRDTTLDGTDTLLGSGSTGFLGANGLSVSIPFDGTWPAFPTYYRLLVNVDADDDANPANDTWVSPMIEVPLAYNETGIDNDDSGPTPPAFSNYSNTGATLGVDQLVRINGTMDLAGGYDTYRITAGAGQTTIEISLFWTSGFDDCDLYLWNDSGGEVTSLDISADMEPDSPPLTIINLIPGNYYFIGVYFYRDGGSRVTPDPYRLYLYGQP